MIVLDEQQLAANAEIWRRESRRPVWAVVKADGYGWGIERIVDAVEKRVAGFCVAESSDFYRVRARTNKPILLFGESCPSELESILMQRGIPNVTTLATLDHLITIAERLGRPIRIRVGRAPALGWFGVADTDSGIFAARAAHRFIEVELWSHYTTAAARVEERAAFTAFCETFAAAGATIVARDLESTIPVGSMTPQELTGDRIRIGAGLFGYHGMHLPGMRNAVTVRAARCVQRRATADLFAGAARHATPATGWLSSVRIGYADGLSRHLVGTRLACGQLVSIGMQYTIIAHTEACVEEYMTLFDAETDLHALLAESRVSGHELLVALGHQSRRQN